MPEFPQSKVHKVLIGDALDLDKQHSRFVFAESVYPIVNST